MPQILAHLSPVAVASVIGAAFLALTRLLTTAKPLWDKLPASLQGLLPVLVLVLPQLAAQAAGVKTTMDLTNLLVLAAAMILPGWHSHTVGSAKPNGPGSAALVGLVFVLGLTLPLGLVGCARFAKVDWAAVEKCGEQPAESALTQIVSGVLAGTGDVKTELEGVAIDYGAGAVKCAVGQIVNDLGYEPHTEQAARKRARGEAFLDSVAK